jgi:hypothetical protein
MIFKCKCGSIKTGQPYRASGESPWLCEKCSPAKRSKEAGDAAMRANGGRGYPSKESFVSKAGWAS